MARNRVVSFSNPTTAMPPVMAQAYAADPRSRLAQAIAQDTTSGRPVLSTGEGLTMLARALVGGGSDWLARRDARQTEDDARAEVGRVISGFGLPTPAASTGAQGAAMGQPPAAAPAAGQPMAAAPPSGAPAAGATPSTGQFQPQQLMQAAIAAATSNNPYLQQQAPLLMQMAQMAQRQAPSPVALGPNQRLVDPASGRVILGPSGGGGGAGGAGGVAGVADLGNSIEGRMISEYQALDQLRTQNRLSPVQAQRLQIIEQHLTAPRVVMSENGPVTINPAPLPRLQSPQAAPQQPFVDPRGMVAGAAPPTVSLQPQPDQAQAPAAASMPPAAQPGRTVTPTPGGGSVEAPTRPARDQPATVVGAMQENVNGLQQVDRALQALNRYPNAVGVLPGIGNLTGWGSQIWDRMDPQGVEVRAAISDIGSLRIHDRSGAAVSASEFPRLRPFIPQVGDSPDAIRQKLQRFQQEYRQMLRDQYSVYGPTAGFRPLPPVEQALGIGQPQPGGATPGGSARAPVAVPRNLRDLQRLSDSDLRAITPDQLSQMPNDVFSAYSDRLIAGERSRGRE